VGVEHVSGVNDSVVIIQIGAEGRSITVVARTSAGGVTEYSVRLRDQTLTFLAEGEADNVIRRDTQWSDRWDDVIASLGRWPWTDGKKRVVRTGRTRTNVAVELASVEGPQL
jgi:hypothetical protein